MKSYLLMAACAVIGLLSQSGAGAIGQTIVPGLSGDCVNNFWDPQNYGWMSFRNNCGQPIHLTIVAFNGTGPFGHGGAMDIRAGGSANIGQSPAEVNASGGGYSTYVCPAGYVAVDNNGNGINAPNEDYRCKQW